MRSSRGRRQGRGAAQSSLQGELHPTATTHTANENHAQAIFLVMNGALTFRAAAPGCTALAERCDRILRSEHEEKPLRRKRRVLAHRRRPDPRQQLMAQADATACASPASLIERGIVARAGHRQERRAKRGNPIRK